MKVWPSRRSDAAKGFRAFGLGFYDSTAGRCFLDVQVHKAFELLQKSEQADFPDVRYEVKVRRSDGSVTLRGIYLREPSDSEQPSSHIVDVSLHLKEVRTKFQRQEGCLLVYMLQLPLRLAIFEEPHALKSSAGLPQPVAALYTKCFCLVRFWEGLHVRLLADDMACPVLCVSSVAYTISSEGMKDDAGRPETGGWPCCQVPASCRERTQKRSA